MPLSSLCCISRRRCQSFPIHEKQHETEVNKIFIRHVERIRVTPPLIINHQQDKKTKTKATVKDKDFNSETYLSDQQTKTQSIIEKKSTHSRISLGRIFHKSNQLKTPSPLPVADIPEAKHDKTIFNTSSSWSLSTNSESNRYKKSSKHRSHVESDDLSKENTSQKTSGNIKSSAKSKLVLENVKKMINDQNIYQQRYHDTGQKESARL